ncbi:MAG: Glu-tRNA(Gln) amidotransferase subunit GatE [Thermoplasmata archaeon]
MKVGLEVHQQLATGKLFCRCPAELSEETGGAFVRRLRPASGEDHRIDIAAQFQASLGRRFVYETGPANCLVEMDEEPPHPLDPAALEVALSFALLVGARVIDEISVMRKIVVDGSNTSGFQRTALVAVGGSISVDGRAYSIQSICLEEDAARKVRESDGEVVYRLDRLGIPLVEVATGPEITSGPEARRVAEEIGALLRATRRVRRGIGTVREDLNVSTEGGHRIEIKGVQELARIREYVDREEQRQRTLLAVRDDLRGRSARIGAVEGTDVSSVFAGVTSGPLAPSNRKGGAVRALALHGFAGLLGSRPGSDERLGREMADHARAVGLRGLIHSDEVPGYGVTEGHISELRALLSLGESDGFVLVSDGSPDRLTTALRRIAARAAEALEGIPGETRDPLPDGRTRYSRPLPGRHRMYPETDIPPISITAEHLDRLRAHLPERPGELRARLEQVHGLGPEVVRQLVYGGLVDRFELLTSKGHSAALTARLLTQDLPAASTAAPPSFDPSDALLDSVLGAAGAGRISKEGIPGILSALAEGAGNVDEAIARAGLGGLSAEELRSLVARIVTSQAPMVRARGAEAFSPLMGDVMREVRGRRDGKEVAEELRRAIARVSSATQG